MSTDSNYNYQHFDPTSYPYTDFQGPLAGQDAIDFELQTVTGETFKLSDHRGKTIVLETGSLTCPMYCNQIEPMSGLCPQFPDVVFVVLYIREAHPGGKVRAHESFESKQANAARVIAEEKEPRTMLVDTLDGEVHRAYGSMPNMVYVISPTGKVRYRSDWGNTERLKQILSESDPESVYKDQHFEPPPPPPGMTFRVFKRAGLQAFWDVISNVRTMLKLHKDADRVFADVTSPTPKH